MCNFLRSCCLPFLLIGAIISCPQICQANGSARLVKSAIKAAHSFKMSEKTSKELAYGIYQAQRYYRYYNQRRHDDTPDDEVPAQRDDGRDDGANWWLIAIGVIVALAVFIVLPYLFCRWLYRKWKRWLDKHKDDWIGCLFRLLRKKPVWISIVVILIAAIAYIHFHEEAKPFAANCLEEVLQADDWRKESDSGTIVFANDEFFGVRIGAGKCGCTDDWLYIPMDAGTAFDDDPLFVSAACSKSVAFGRIVSMGVSRELSPKVTRAILEEDDLSGRVKRAMVATLSMIGEPYRSRGWFWNGSEFVIGATNSKEADKGFCVYVGCRVVEKDGKPRAYVNAHVKSSYLEMLAVLERALQDDKAGRELLMDQEAREAGMTFEEFSRECEKSLFPGIFGIKLGDVVQGKQPIKTNDGAISSLSPTSAESFSNETVNVKECEIFQLPLSHRVFKIGWRCCASNKDDALALYRQIADYFEDHCQHRLYDELHGKPRPYPMCFGANLLRRDSIAFPHNRRLTLECYQAENGEMCVEIIAVDHELQKQLPKEVGTTLENDRLK